MEDIKIKVVYKNKQLQTISQKTYHLDEYCSNIKSKLISILQDVELVFVDKNESYDKFEWDIKELEQFHRIRHALLDVANNVERIPQNIIKE